MWFRVVRLSDSKHNCLVLARSRKFLSCVQCFIFHATWKIPRDVALSRFSSCLALSTKFFIGSCSSLLLIATTKNLLDLAQHSFCMKTLRCWHSCFVELQETINFNDGSSSKSFQVVDKQSHLFFMLLYRNEEKEKRKMLSMKKEEKKMKRFVLGFIKKNEREESIIDDILKLDDYSSSSTLLSEWNKHFIFWQEQ